MNNKYQVKLKLTPSAELRANAGDPIIEQWVEAENVDAAILRAVFTTLQFMNAASDEHYSRADLETFEVVNGWGE